MTDKPRDFGLMTAQELAEYSGMVYLARCTFESKHSGKTIACDYECPSVELRTAAIVRGRHMIGSLLTSELRRYERRQTGRKWAKAFGGINGRCGTNPEDVPDVMMTADEFWRNHSNSNSGG